MWNLYSFSLSRPNMIFFVIWTLLPVWVGKNSSESWKQAGYLRIFQTELVEHDSTGIRNTVYLNSTCLGIIFVQAIWFAFGMDDCMYACRGCSWNDLTNGLYYSANIHAFYYFLLFVLPTFWEDSNLRPSGWDATMLVACPPQELKASWEI